MQIDERPYANICLTDYCNFQCYYCQPGGENHRKSEHINLPLNITKEMLKALALAGVSRIRITGGEPTLNPFFTEIFQYALGLSFTKIRLSTNGYLVDKYIDVLRNKKIRVQVSLDTLERDKFAYITGQDNLPKVLSNLELLHQEGINTRINFVAMKSNMDEIPNIVRYCEENGFAVKILGLELLDCFKKKEVLNERLDDKVKQMMLNRLGEISGQTMAPGELGIPMNEYKSNNVSVRTRFYDGWGAKYLHYCKKCSIFPCPSGIYGIQILADGEVSLCRFRRAPGFNFLKCKDSDEIYNRLIYMLDELVIPNMRVEQTEEVAFGTEEFIKVPESSSYDKM